MMGIQLSSCLVKRVELTIYAPIVLFVYNRPLHTKQTIEALQRNSLAAESELFIYSDAPKNESAISEVARVREYIATVKGFKKVTITEREHNLGLAKSIIDGVTSIVDDYSKVIVLEDDLVTSPYFLQFMNDGLSMYQSDAVVASIHGYVYPIDNTDLPESFFVKGADCWGWATWKRAWSYFESDGGKLLNEIRSRKLERAFDYDGSYPLVKMLKGQIAGKNNSWAIRWYASAYLQGMLTLYPSRSLVRNIGQDCSGTHSGYGTFFDGELCMEKIVLQKQETVECIVGRERFVAYLKSIKRSFVTKVVNKLRYYAVRFFRQLG
jgi:Glycosyl transferase family 2